MKRCFFLSAVMLIFSVSGAEAQEGRLLRFPSVGGDKIAFTYAGDLYTVPIDGGKAVRLTSDIGYEMFSKFSPDGKTIAFTAQYDGNTEVYTVPAEGGMPRRVTYTALVSRDNIGDRMGPDNIVMGWTPDGKDIIYRSKWYNFSGLRGILCTVSAEGGDPVQIPATEGGFCSYSPDGKYLAMNRMFREFRTWKYYRGGQADDIWVNKVGTTELEKITDNDAQDVFPMWIGDEIYYLSDRDSIMNLFCYDTRSRNTRKVTDFRDYDCKFPSFSQEHIVFENAGFIYKYSVREGVCEKVPVQISAEAVYARSEFSEPMGSNGPMGIGGARSYDLAPDGSRVLMTIHGDVVSLPASKGAIYNISSTPGAQEREAGWSPDGKWIAYLSDVSGEYQIYLADAGDFAVKKCLTSFTDGYPEDLSWSPDSKYLYFTGAKRDFYRLDISSGALKMIFRGQYSGVSEYDISPDGRFVAYSTSASNRVQVINIYDVEKDTHHTVTSLWYESADPVFSGDGKYLFFCSCRGLQPDYSQVEWNASFDVNRSIWVLPLAVSTPNPCLPSGEEWTPSPAPDQKKEPDAKKEKDVPEVHVAVDFDGIVERAVELPIKGIGRIMPVMSIADELYYYAGGELCSISMKDLKTRNVGNTRLMAVTSGGKYALTLGEDGYHVVSSPSFKSDLTVPVKEAAVWVDYRQQWKQIFDETWRIYRDGFYVENMVGKPWQKIHDKYAVLLPYVNHRQDLTYIIGEMISELATGHCYVTTGMVDGPERIATGLLGARLSREEKSGAYRIDHIYKGVSWDSHLYSPLGMPGIGVSEGDYILEVNRQPVSGMVSIYQSLIGKVGQTVALKVASSPSGKDARTIYVKPVGDESSLAYYEWVQRNIEIVSEASDGEIGYIHIPDMGVDGLKMFTRMFYNQLDKKALIIDDRMNGGGNVSPMILERLQREAYRMTMSRNGGATLMTVPNEMHYGPKVCLIDKYSSSDGDLFPYGFRELGIGKLIGMRTWGGIVGISGSKPYMDGQDVRTPFFTSYSTDGKWIIENHGVDPDIIVDINPFEDFLGHDAQLLKAVEVLKEELKNLKPLPGVPADPVR